jgi:hypothetical protein
MLFGLQFDDLWKTIGLSPASFTLGLVVALFLMLAFTSLAPDLILMKGVLLLLLAGII